MRDLLAGISLLLCLMALTVSLIALVKPIPRLKLANRKQAMKGLGIAFALFIFTAIMIPASSENRAEPAAPAGTVKASDNQIASVETYAATQHGVVKVDLENMRSETDLLTHVANTVAAAGRAIKEGAPDVPAQIETLNFWFTAPLVDNYGKEAHGKVMEFRIRTADLRQIQYENIPPEGVLEFAQDIEVRPAARDGVRKYCAGNRTQNIIFCAAVSR